MSTHRVEGKIPCCLAKMSMDPWLQLEAAQEYIGGALLLHLYSLEQSRAMPLILDTVFLCGNTT